MTDDIDLVKVRLMGPPEAVQLALDLLRDSLLVTGESQVYLNRNGGGVRVYLSVLIRHPAAGRGGTG